MHCLEHYDHAEHLGEPNQEKHYQNEDRGAEGSAKVPEDAGPEQRGQQEMQEEEEGKGRQIVKIGTRGALTRISPMPGGKETIKGVVEFQRKDY